MEIQGVILAVIIGTLAAIVYSLRILVMLERRIAKIEIHIEKMTSKVISEEIKIERAVSRPKRKK